MCESLCSIRAKSLKDKKWIYGYFVKEQEKVYIQNETGKHEILEDTICHSIDFKDNTGNLIYEHDYVYNQQVFEVRWIPQRAAFVLFNKNGIKEEITINAERLACVVIGNAIDNPIL